MRQYDENFFQLSNEEITEKQEVENAKKELETLPTDVKILQETVLTLMDTLSQIQNGRGI